MTELSTASDRLLALFTTEPRLTDFSDLSCTKKKRIYQEPPPGVEIDTLKSNKCGTDEKETPEDGRYFLQVKFYQYTVRTSYSKLPGCSELLLIPWRKLINI